MNCKKCSSERVAKVSGKCSDMCSVRTGCHKLNDYVPSDMGIGGGDYLEFDYCLNCGQLQGEFPIPKTELETEENADDDDQDPNSRFPLER